MIEIFKTEKIPSDFLEAIRLSMNYGFISKKEIWDWALKTIQFGGFKVLTQQSVVKG